MFRVFRKSRVKSARKNRGERFSNTSDQPIDDDLFSSSDGAFDISVITKSLLSPLVSVDVALLWELESFFMSIDIVFYEDTEISTIFVSW